MCRPPRLSVSGGYRAPFLSATACRANQKLVQLRHAHIYHIYPVFMSLWVILHIVAQISWSLTEFALRSHSRAASGCKAGNFFFQCSSAAAGTSKTCHCQVDTSQVFIRYSTFSALDICGTLAVLLYLHILHIIYHIIFHWWIAQHFDLDWKVGGPCCYCDLGREAGLEYSSCTRFANNINMIYDDYDGWWSLSWFMQFLCSYAISIHFCYITICNNHI